MLSSSISLVSWETLSLATLVRFSMSLRVLLSFSTCSAMINSRHLRWQWMDSGTHVMTYTCISLWPNAHTMTPKINCLFFLSPYTQYQFIFSPLSSHPAHLPYLLSPTYSVCLPRSFSTSWGFFLLGVPRSKQGASTMARLFGVMQLMCSCWATLEKVEGKSCQRSLWMV